MTESLPRSSIIYIYIHTTQEPRSILKDLNGGICDIRPRPLAHWLQFFGASDCTVQCSGSKFQALSLRVSRVHVARLISLSRKVGRFQVFDLSGCDDLKRIQYLLKLLAESFTLSAGGWVFCMRV